MGKIAEATITPFLRSKKMLLNKDIDVFIGHLSNIICRHVVAFSTTH